MNCMHECGTPGMSNSRICPDVIGDWNVSLFVPDSSALNFGGLNSKSHARR